MGYYKRTIYSGPNAEDRSDPDPEARAARRITHQPTCRCDKCRAKQREYDIVTRWPDKPVCIVCEAQAPDGMTWVEGICTNCRELTR